MTSIDRAIHFFFFANGCPNRRQNKLCFHARDTISTTAAPALQHIVVGIYRLGSMSFQCFHCILEYIYTAFCSTFRSSLFFVSVVSSERNGITANDDDDDEKTAAHTHNRACDVRWGFLTMIDVFRWNIIHVAIIHCGAVGLLYFHWRYNKAMGQFRWSNE